jgi:mono/diheme cytochrome c family protein
LVNNHGKQTRRRLVLFAAIGSLGACSPRIPATAKTLDAGERIYSGNCVACHQSDGRGIPNVYPSLAGSPVVLGDPAVLALWVIKGQRPAGMPPGRYPTVMLQFGWLKDQDAAAILSYVRSSFGNAAAPVDAATIARAMGR